MSLALTGPVYGVTTRRENRSLPATFADLPLARACSSRSSWRRAPGHCCCRRRRATRTGRSSWRCWPGRRPRRCSASTCRSRRRARRCRCRSPLRLRGLLLLGPHPTLLIAAVAVWVQCTVNVSPRNPLHRTAFSMAAVAVTAKAAGLVFLGLGGDVAFAVPGLVGQEKAILGAALTYFVLNTLLTAMAVSLTSGQPLAKVWNEHAVWSALSYIVGAGVAATAAVLLSGDGAWLTPLLVGSALPDVSHVSGLLRSGRGRAPSRRRDGRTCTWRRSRRWPWPSTPRTRPRPHGSGGCRCMPRAWRASSACRRPTYRASARRRCCTTSASSRCPSTSCRSPVR